MNYLAVDVGGTKTLVAVFDADGGITEKQKFPTPHEYEEFVRQTADCVAGLTTKDFKAACVALPGRIDRKHGAGLAFGNLPWTNVPVQDDFEQAFRCPVIVENDANLAGLSEALEIIHDYKKVLYVTISTGIGGILAIDGVMDVDTLDAEIGHMLMEHDGRLMRWEDFASGRAIVEKYGKKASEITDERTWYIIARNIALGLISVIAAYTPDAIILGGGVGTHLEKFKNRLDEELKIYENPMVSIPPILQAKRPEEAVIYGCYHLVRDRYGTA